MKSQPSSKAVLLINFGTPESPRKKSIYKYLRKLLNDPFVIDMPRLIRFLLVNLIIVPFRINKSTKLYQRVWTKSGSPILLHVRQLGIRLQQQLKQEGSVYIAMHYGSPPLKEVLLSIDKAGFETVEVIPLFPQYASSTTGSIFHTITKQKVKLQHIRKIRYLKQFYNDTGFIEAFRKRIAGYRPETFDHIVFSFHSLPERHILAARSACKVHGCACEQGESAWGDVCYKAASYQTARLIARALDLSSETYTVAFQSNLSKKWIGPFTRDVVIRLAQEGKSRILIVAPSFVVDCLETIIEIGQDYRQLFLLHGGKELMMCESLNAEDYWIEALHKMILSGFSQNDVCEERLSKPIGS